MEEIRASILTQCAANAVVDALTKILAPWTLMEELAQVTRVTQICAAITTSLTLSSPGTSAAGVEVEHPTSPLSLTMVMAIADNRTDARVLKATIGTQTTTLVTGMKNSPINAVP
jgi:hypothetical protein